MLSFNFFYNQGLHIKVIFIEILNLNLLNKGGSIGNTYQRLQLQFV